MTCYYNVNIDFFMLLTQYDLQNLNDSETQHAHVFAV